MNLRKWTKKQERAEEARKEEGEANYECTRKRQREIMKLVSVAGGLTRNAACNFLTAAIRITAAPAAASSASVEVLIYARQIVSFACACVCVASGYKDGKIIASLCSNIMHEREGLIWQ
jgi:hypothetical protein